MNFNELYTIYGDTLPSKEVFFSDGKHTITPKLVAKHYNARKVHTVWDKFSSDYRVFVKAKQPKQKPKEEK